MWANDSNARRLQNKLSQLVVVMGSSVWLGRRYRVTLYHYYSTMSCAAYSYSLQTAHGDESYTEFDRQLGGHRGFLSLLRRNPRLNSRR